MRYMSTVIEYTKVLLLQKRQYILQEIEDAGACHDLWQ